MPTIKLTKSQYKQIERLASIANTTPKKVFELVLEDGLEYTEELLKSINEALADKSPSTPHDEVVAEMEKHHAEYKKRFSGKTGYRIVKDKTDYSDDVSYQLRTAFYNDDDVLVAVTSSTHGYSASTKKKLVARISGISEATTLPTINVKRLGMIEYHGLLFTPAEIQRCAYLAESRTAKELSN